VQGTPELGHPVAAQCAPLVDTKHAVLVAVKRYRLAPGFEIGAGRMEIGKGRLALDKLQVHQPTGRVVDEHEQGALRTTILKPPMLAAVDLHQLADAVAPGTGLMHALAPLLAIAPQPGFDHPQPQRLTTERDPMNLAQLLGRQCRAEIPVPLANHRQHRSPQRRGLVPIARATALLRNQARRTVGSIGLGVNPTFVSPGAKRLIDETSLPMTEIAMRAGFGSLRRFNSVFAQVYGRPPTEIRRKRSSGAMVLA
jgi:hypothetical protein